MLRIIKTRVKGQKSFILNSEVVSFLGVYVLLSYSFHYFFLNIFHLSFFKSAVIDCDFFDQPVVVWWNFNMLDCLKNSASSSTWLDLCILFHELPRLPYLAGCWLYCYQWTSNCYYHSCVPLYQETWIAKIAFMSVWVLNGSAQRQASTVILLYKFFGANCACDSEVYSYFPGPTQDLLLLCLHCYMLHCFDITHYTSGMFALVLENR